MSKFPVTNLAVSASPVFGDVLQNMKNAADAESYSAAGARFEMDIRSAFRHRRA